MQTGVRHRVGVDDFPDLEVQVDDDEISPAHKHTMLRHLRTPPARRARRRVRPAWRYMIGGTAALACAIAALALTTAYAPSIADASTLYELVALFIVPWVGPVSNDCVDGAGWCAPRYPLPLPRVERARAASAPPLALDALLAARNGTSFAPSPRLVMGTQTFNYGDMSVEWVMFHLAQGVSHIYIYDDVGDDRISQRLGIFVRSGVVTIFSVWPDNYEMFAGQYPSHHLLSLLKADGVARGDDLMQTWMLWADMDEYFFSPPTRLAAVPITARDAPLADALARAPRDVDRIVLRGKVFGTSGWETFAPAEDGLLIETHTRRPPYSLGEALGPAGLACCGHCSGAVLSNAWKTWLRVGRTPLAGNEHMLHMMHTAGETLLVTPFRGATWLTFHHYMYASLRIVRRKAAISTTVSQAGYYASLIRDTRCRRTFVERVDDRAVAPLWPAVRTLWRQWRAAAPAWRTAAQLAALPHLARPISSDSTFVLRAYDGSICGVSPGTNLVECRAPPRGAPPCVRAAEWWSLAQEGVADAHYRLLHGSRPCGVTYSGQLQCNSRSDGDAEKLPPLLVKRFVAADGADAKKAGPHTAAAVVVALIDDGGADGARDRSEALYRPLRACLKARYPVATLFVSGTARRGYLNDTRDLRYPAEYLTRGVGTVRCTRGLVDDAARFELVPLSAVQMCAANVEVAKD